MKEIKSWHDTFYTHLISKGITTKKAAHTQDVTVAIKKNPFSTFLLPMLSKKNCIKSYEIFFYALMWHWLEQTL